MTANPQKMEATSDNSFTSNVPETENNIQNIVTDPYTVYTVTCSDHGILFYRI